MGFGRLMPAMQGLRRPRDAMLQALVTAASFKTVPTIASSGALWDCNLSGVHTRLRQRQGLKDVVPVLLPPS
jgi:hypothetical protein